MTELILFDGYYLPPFLRITLLSLGLWTLARIGYKSRLYTSDLFHPSLCDICILACAFGISATLLKGVV